MTFTSLHDKSKVVAQPAVLQRTCARGGNRRTSGECDEFREKKRTLKCYAVSNARLSSVPTNVDLVLRNSGSPLDAETRRAMENGFREDFSGVRIHANETAANSARAINAKAYTVGSHIVFGASQYRPNTSDGRRLLAHELTHTIQQRSATTSAFGPPALVNNSRSERVADATADRFASGQSALVDSGFTGVGIARQFISRNLASLGNEALRLEFEILKGRLAEPVSYSGQNADEQYLSEIMDEMMRRGIGQTRLSEPERPQSRRNHEPRQKLEFGNQDAEDLIDAQTAWGNLKEDDLGRTLLQHAVNGDYHVVARVLDELGFRNRDDVSYELILNATDSQIDTLASSDDGAAMLDRLYDELTAGSAAEKEIKQADRIIQSKTRKIGSKEFEEQAFTAKIFPYRLPGLTVLDDAPIMARRVGNGKIWIKMPVRVLGTDMFREEAKTLPPEVFVGGYELPVDEVVGVKMYDLGGSLHFRPALYLVQLANETTSTTLQKIGEAAALGLSFGTGAIVGAGARGTLSIGGRVLLWADGVAAAIAGLSTVILEHRGWIISEFGAAGRDFLRYVDIASSAVALYGGVRAIAEMTRLASGLVSRARSLRSTSAARHSLTAEQRAVVQRVEDYADELEDALRTGGESTQSSGRAAQARSDLEDLHQSETLNGEIFIDERLPHGMRIDEVEPPQLSQDPLAETERLIQQGASEKEIVDAYKRSQRLDTHTSGSTTPSQRLRAALEVDGIPVPPGHDAHHIVPSRGGGMWGNEAREILRQAGIGLDTATNGVPLPRSAEIPRVARQAISRHQRMHTRTYYENVAHRLRVTFDSLGSDGIADELRAIRREIIDAEFPH